MDLIKANSMLTQVKLRLKGERIYIRGTFPSNGVKKQKDISTQCLNTPEQIKIALAKAKKIESDLILGRYEETQKQTRLTVKEAIEQFVKAYWIKNIPTTNKLHNFKVNSIRDFAYLPEDEIFSQSLIEKAIKSFPTGSYARHHFIVSIRPVAKYYGIEIDYAKFGKYQAKEKSLPKLSDIIEVYQSMPNIFKWQHERKFIIGVLFTFGLRPHEFYRSTFNFNQSVPTVTVHEKTKTGSRTVYALPHPDIDIFNLEIPTFNVNLDLPNTRLGHQLGKKLVKYPFTAYQLRHYYAVRGAVEGLSPVTMAKWMGHSLKEHFDSYASLLSDIESEQIWLNKFQN